MDYGSVRTGLAVTDPLRLSINPLDTISTTLLEDTLLRKLAEGQIDTVVFGYPTHADGTATELVKKIEILKKNIQSKFPSVRFVMIDESYTSKEAMGQLIFMGVKKKQRRNKSTIDQMSAVIILKKYLESIEA